MTKLEVAKELYKEAWNRTERTPFQEVDVFEPPSEYKRKNYCTYCALIKTPVASGENILEYTGVTDISEEIDVYDISCWEKIVDEIKTDVEKERKAQKKEKVSGLV